MSVKFAVPGLFKINAFWNKDYDVITSVYVVISKVLSPFKSYCKCGPTWPKWLLECMALTFYSSVVKRVKLKVRKLWGLISTFEEVAGKKMVGLANKKQIELLLHKKWSFLLKISSVNVTKPAGNCGFGHIY